jgi:hypothetical protein
VAALAGLASASAPAPIADPNLAGYKVYWRTTSPTWDHARWVGTATEVVLENIVVDNYIFGVPR